MSGRYVHDGGWNEFPTPEYYADAESLEDHYADEINGNDDWDDDPDEIWLLSQNPGAA